MLVEEVEPVLLEATLDDDAAALAHPLLRQHLHLLEQDDGRDQGEQFLGQNALAGSEEPHDTPTLHSGRKDSTDWSNTLFLNRISTLKT